MNGGYVGRQSREQIVFYEMLSCVRIYNGGGSLFSILRIKYFNFFISDTHVIEGVHRSFCACGR